MACRAEERFLKVGVLHHLTEEWLTAIQAESMMILRCPREKRSQFTQALRNSLPLWTWSGFGDLNFLD